MYSTSFCYYSFILFTYAFGFAYDVVLLRYWVVVLLGMWDWQSVACWTWFVPIMTSDSNIFLL